MELKFTAPGLKGKLINFALNDSFIRYMLLRLRCSEDVCIEAIEHIKKRSGKKCVLILGNCQARAIQNLLLKHSEFMREYFILDLPFDFDWYPDTSTRIFENGGKFLSLVDLLIAQRIEKKNYRNGFFSTKKFIDKLRPDTKIVFIPKMDFRAYFSQQVSADEPLNEKMKPHQHFKFVPSDRYIYEIMELSGMNPDIEKILDQISNENFIPPDIIQTGIDDSLKALKKSDWQADVKIADYIEDNFRFKQIFYSAGHPIPLVIFEMTRRILRFIGMKSDFFLNYTAMIDEKNLNLSLLGQDMPIYPAVKKFFNFYECQEIYHANKYIWEFHGNFRDYIREYIRVCWHEKFS